MKMNKRDLLNNYSALRCAAPSYPWTCKFFRLYLGNHYSDRLQTIAQYSRDVVKIKKLIKKNNFWKLNPCNPLRNFWNINFSNVLTFRKRMRCFGFLFNVRHNKCTENRHKGKKSSLVGKLEINKCPKKNVQIAIKIRTRNLLSYYLH